MQKKQYEQICINYLMIFSVINCRFACTHTHTFYIYLLFFIFSSNLSLEELEKKSVWHKIHLAPLPLLSILHLASFFGN